MRDNYRKWTRQYESLTGYKKWFMCQLGAYFDPNHYSLVLLWFCRHCIDFCSAESKSDVGGDLPKLRLRSTLTFGTT